MSSLDSHKLYYEDLPLNTRKTGGKDSKMSKKEVATPVANSKPSKKYAPTRLEVFKTVLIAVMFTAIVAFVGGMSFQKSHDVEIKQAVSAAQAPVAEVKK